MGKKIPFKEVNGFNRSNEYYRNTSGNVEEVDENAEE